MLLEVVKDERGFGTSYVLEFQEQLFLKIPFTFHCLFFVKPECLMVTKVQYTLTNLRLKAAGLFKHMTFCYHPTLKG